MSTSYLETTFGSARIISHHHHKKTVAFITHGEGKGLDAVDLSATIHNLNNHAIRDTKLYWIISRCLVEYPEKRSILYL